VPLFTILRSDGGLFLFLILVCLGKYFVLKEAPLGCRISLPWLKKPSLHTIRIREETKFYQTLKLC